MTQVGFDPEARIHLSRSIEVVRVRITEAGRRILERGKL
jgi:hypothetical protein